MVKYKLTSIIVILLMIATPNLAQEIDSKSYKEGAVAHMQSGKYGEAIDLLNKYISAYPRNASGYNLRGLCFEKRNQFQSAMYDFRKARQLQSTVREYVENLDRVTRSLHNYYDGRIKGYQRELAIDIQNPYNYLEIGKSYFHMESYDNAEKWYDEFLERESNPSPDEVLRYTEILTKTGKLKKGEKLLKKYVEKHPDDWRLWSRYGYYNLWLGKFNTSQKAFGKSLEIKPYFKEAQDGMDLAKRRAYLTRISSQRYRKEYPIDKYYRILKTEPQNDGVRFKLVNELIKNERIEEAYQQLLIVQDKYPQDSTYLKKLAYVNNIRELKYTEKVKEYKKTFDNEPDNKNVLFNLVEYLGYMGHYEEVRNILQSYINDNPNDYDTKLRYYYAQSLIWLSDYDSALPIIRILTEEYPEVIKYRLLYAQALAWSDKDINESEINVSYILERDPQNLNALLLKISLNISKQEFDTAQNIINSVKLINPYNKDVDILQSNLDSERMFFIKNQLYESGKKLFLEGKCSEALPYYKEIVLMDSSDTLIYKEYGDVNYCSENYEKALSIYEDLLDNDFKYNIAMDRANLLLKMGDTLKAVDAYKNIIINKPYDFHSNLYVADLYSLTEQYDSANAVYDKLLLSDLQPDQLQIVKQRKKWVPAQGFASALASFPSYVGVAPIGTIYVDNISFRLNKVGSKLDLGISNFLTVGVSYYKTKLRGNDLQKNLSTYKGHGQFKIGKYFSFGAEYGVLRSSRETHDKIIITSIRINKENVYSVGGIYTQTDAAVILYSPYLIDKSMRADSYKFDGNYKHKSGVQFSGYFQYLDIKENDITRGNNYGNQFQFRLGKLFHKTIIAGYELYYIDYKYESNLYYSPNDFESHSIWLDWTIEKDKYHDIRLGGKFGYISQSDVTIREIYGDAFYFVADQLKISMKVAFGSSFRFDSSYNYFSWILSAYLSLD